MAERGDRKPSTGGNERKARRSRNGSGGNASNGASTTRADAGGSSANGNDSAARKRGRSKRRSRWGSERYKKKVDERLFGKKGDAAKTRLQERLRSAQGSENFLKTYREYVRGFGMPDDIPTLLMLLDIDDEKEGLKVLEALGTNVADAPIEQRKLVRGRLRNLEMSTSSDAMADAATELLERL